MNPDIMQQLAMLLAGTQQPAVPTMQATAQKSSPQMAPGGSAILLPGNDPGFPIGGLSGPYGGGKEKHRPLTAAQKQENRGALRGPRGYTPVMKANVGMKAVTPGYGNNPTPAPSGFTQFIDLFTPPKGVV